MSSLLFRNSDVGDGVLEQTNEGSQQTGTDHLLLSLSHDGEMVVDFDAKPVT